MSSTKGLAAKTVTVGCKLAQGIVLRGFRPVEKQEAVIGGGLRSVTEWVETGERVTINGVASRQGHLPPTRNADGTPNFDQPCLLNEFGYALTPNVPKALWDAWLENNKNSDIVKNNIIFAHVDRASVKAQARENETRRSGMEPINPDNPGGKVEPSDEMKKRLQGQRLHV